MKMVLTLSRFILGLWSFLLFATISNARSFPYKRDVPSTLPGTWTSVGCYVDVGRTLTEGGYDDNDGMTDESCIEYCESQGFIYAGTEWYHECYCGNTLAPGSGPAPDGECTTPCAGDPTETCGGPNRLNLFYSGESGPEINPGDGLWSFIGCYEEGTTGRTLEAFVDLPGGAEMTIDGCTSACQSEGYTYAGVEFGDECWCGDSFENGGGPAIDGDAGCSMTCPGNHSEYCGGPLRLEMYGFSDALAALSPTSSSSSTSSAATSSYVYKGAAPSTSSSAPSAAISPYAYGAAAPSSVVGSSPSSSTGYSAAASSSVSTSDLSPSSSDSLSSPSSSTDSGAAASSSVPSSTASYAGSSPSSSSSAASSSSSSEPAASSSTALSTAASSSISSSASSAASSSSIDPPAAASSSTSSRASSSSSSSIDPPAAASSSTSSSASSFSPSSSIDPSAAASCSSVLSAATACYSLLGSTTLPSAFPSYTYPSAFPSYSPSGSCSQATVTVTVTANASSSSLYPSATVSSSSSSSADPAAASSSSSSFSSSLATTSSSDPSAVASSPYSSAASSSSSTDPPSAASSSSSYSVTVSSSSSSSLAAASFSYSYPSAASSSSTSDPPAAAASSSYSSGAVSSSSADPSAAASSSYVSGAASSSISSNPPAATSSSFSAAASSTLVSTTATSISSSQTSSTSVYLPKIPTPSTVPSTLDGQCVFVGCYTEGTTSRALKDDILINYETMTVEICTSFCFSAGYSLAGVEWSGECYCGDELQPGSIIRPITECSMPCDGAPLEFCGAGSRLDVYSCTATPTSPSLTSAAALVAPTPSPVQAAGSYELTGCYTEATNSRALTGAILTDYVAMTVEMCAAFCTPEFSLFGLEWSGECYCGDVLQAGSEKVSSLECNMPCDGDEDETCGAGMRLDIYSYTPGTSSTPVVTTTTTSIVASASPTLVPTPTSSAPTIDAGEWTYYGCQTEGTDGRALNSKATAYNAMTLESCAADCAGYTYFGVEYGRECYCGNTFSFNSVPAAAIDCSFPCAGDSDEICGAGLRLSVYVSSVAPPTKLTQVGAPITEGYTYYGCQTEGSFERALPDQATAYDTMTVESCALDCAGYTYFGVEYGRECYCGNAFSFGSLAVPNAECNFVCEGDADEICGASQRLSVYEFSA